MRAYSKILNLFYNRSQRYHVRCPCLLLESITIQRLLTCERKWRSDPINWQFGETYSISIPIEEDSTLVPFPTSLDIVYEDKHLLVINKNSGLVVHPSSGHDNDTLVNALLFNKITLSSGFTPSRPGIVHRIDKDTSGLIVVCKTDLCQEHLASQFKNKEIHRIYHALIYGTPKQPQQTIESYLIRHPKHRKKFANEIINGNDEPRGKKAITHVKTLHSSPKGISLVQCKLETGRTHQIRVHLSEKSLPIVGDPIYSSKGYFKNLKSSHLKKVILDNSRLCLHASELGFIHPTENRMMYFKSSWPKEIQPLLSFLEIPEPCKI